MQNFLPEWENILYTFWAYYAYDIVYILHIVYLCIWKNYAYDQKENVCDLVSPPDFATQTCWKSIFSIIRHFLPNPGRILTALTFNGLRPQNVNARRILPGFGRKWRIIEKLI